MSAVLLLLLCADADPLPSWNDGPARKSILGFVKRVTQKGGKEYVRPAERIAVFDNDGTLWCEQPMYVQIRFAFDRVKALAPKRPEWKEKQPFKAVLEGDFKTLAAAGEKGIVEIVLATHGGLTEEEFDAVVREWIKSARHPKYKRPFTECVYKPMLELLAYLRANGFKTYIVSGGGTDFIRPWAEEVYGVPPEQVIGSTLKTKYEERDGKPVVVRLPEVEHVDDKVGKPLAISKHIGRRPLMAFGNSDGDYEMLRYTASGAGPRFGLIVHHTDGTREYAYGRGALFGKLDKALEEAPKRGWAVVDMKKDWKKVFAFEE